MYYILFIILLILKVGTIMTKDICGLVVTDHVPFSIATNLVKLDYEQLDESIIRIWDVSLEPRLSSWLERSLVHAVCTNAKIIMYIKSK